MKLELLTNATVVDDAIRFVMEHGKFNTRISSNTGISVCEKRSNNHTHTLEIQETDDLHQPSDISTTTNQVF
jgi:hypothetical protein